MGPFLILYQNIYSLYINQRPLIETSRREGTDSIFVKKYFLARVKSNNIAPVRKSPKATVILMNKIKTRESMIELQIKDPPLLYGNILRTYSQKHVYKFDPVTNFIVSLLVSYVGYILK